MQAQFGCSCCRVLESLPYVGVNAFHHGLDLSSWPELMKLRLAIADKRFQNTLPLDRLDQLPTKHSCDCGALWKKIGRHIRVGRDARCLDLDCGQDLQRVTMLAPEHQNLLHSDRPIRPSAHERHAFLIMSLRTYSCNTGTMRTLGLTGPTDHSRRLIAFGQQQLVCNCIITELL